MRIFHFVLDTGARPRFIRSDVLPIGWRQNLVTSVHLPGLGDAKSRPLQLLVSVFVRLRLGNSHFRVSFIVMKHLAASMIFGIDFLDSHVRAISCMEVIVEMTPGTVCILHRNKATVDPTEAEVSTPIKRVDKTTYFDKAAVTRSAIQSEQMIHVSPMTQVPLMVRSLLPRLLHTERKNAIQLTHVTEVPYKVFDFSARTAVIQRGPLVEPVTVDHITPALAPLS